jgi:hypothetical protein
MADELAQWAAELLWDDINQAFPAENCRLLSSIADALDAIPDDIARGVAWCTRVAGASQIIAVLLGAIAKLVIESHVAPLHTVAQEIRLIGRSRVPMELIASWTASAPGAWSRAFPPMPQRVSWIVSWLPPSQG